MDTIANATAIEQATDGIIRNEMANMQTGRMWPMVGRDINYSTRRGSEQSSHIE
jgi:hypothetical protein